MTDGASVGSGADGQLPVLILGGYLGSGKTTLLNRLLRLQHGLRLAVLVNDFGSINVDAALVESSHGETIALTNGCICCGMADGFVRVMYRLRERAQQLDGVIVETSGVADPAQTAAYATLPGESPAAVIVLVDAERVQKLARDPLIGRAIHRQLDAADVAIITKGDLAGPSRVAEIGTWIKTVHPAARVIATPADEAPIALLFEVMQPAEGSELHTAYSRQAPTGAAAHADHDKLYERAVAIPQNPVTESELRRWYAALPDEVLRVKGWVQLSDYPGKPVLVQGVGSRLEITQGRSGALPQAAVLVLLGLSGSLRDVTAPDGTPLEGSN